MNVREARRTRHLVIRLDKGEELPAALVRALDEAEARSAWITGVGALEAAELVLYDQHARNYATPRRIDGGCEVVSISGNVALLDGTTSVRLSAVLARETDRGLETFGGQLIWGRAFGLELHVVVFDDLALTRVADERTGLPTLSARPPSAAGAIAAPAVAMITDAPGPAPSPTAAAIPLPAPPPTPTASATQHHDNPAMPQRPAKPRDDVEIYPDAGDAVMHFHFGECTVVSSDGDRIRLRQDKDGRVREVALTMLKIEAPTTANDGRRLFKLGRKN